MSRVEPVLQCSWIGAANAGLAFQQQLAGDPIYPPEQLVGLLRFTRLPVLP